MKRILFFIIPFLLLTACTGGREPDPTRVDTEEPGEEGTADRAILLYGAAANSLDGNLCSDINEIVSQAKTLRDNHTRFIIFSARRNINPVLMEVKWRNNAAQLDTLKTYDLTLTAVQPDRLTEVIADFSLLAEECTSRGLIMWSHSTGWTPPTTLTWFGEDITVSPKERGDVPALAACIPDNYFDFIWFDSCYMANIESAYEFRKKCKYYIGYATEVWADGMPYDLTLPYLTAEVPDYAGAVYASYAYYAARPSNNAYTGAVYDMSKITALARAAQPLLTSGNPPTGVSDLLQYSRSQSTKLYDFEQLTVLQGRLNGVSEETVSAFRNAVADFVTYKIISEMNFSGLPWDVTNYSGISSSIFNPSSVLPAAEYYRTLAWYRAIYGDELPPDDDPLSGVPIITI